MILNAAIITLLGMGTVFVFLLIMVAAMDATRAILPYLDRFMPASGRLEGKTSPPPAVVAGNDAAIAASIAAAYASSGRTL